ncbi:hypothetical protein [Cohnella terricola]|uniref:DUF1453 domain-containing protein n=1 Tax=Cohnella terricola TaxID=1289167 RepID=A0A559JTC2_9BACL|nr:hypothetical protein [Cohnella terricola]TVY03124.1 hypothetical protein FPZ45_04375 [Cohnella terricola]
MTTYIIVVIVVVLLSLREKEIKPSRLWVTPILFSFLMLSRIDHLDFKPISLLLYLVCLLLGLAIGVWRGKLQKVRMNPDTGKITSRGSILGIVVFLAVMLLRNLAAYWGAHSAFLSLSTAVLFISLANIFARRYIIFKKYQEMAGLSGRRV